MQRAVDSRLAIDPQIRLKSDVDRAILITRPLPLSHRAEFCKYLHPLVAVLLALFDGQRTIAEVTSLWTRLADKDPEVARQQIGRVVDTFSDLKGAGDVFVDVNETNRAKIRTYEPKEFVVPANRVDLDDPRLRSPYVVYFLPSLFCPQKCVYCYAKTCSKPEEDMIPRGRLKEIFAELAEIGVEVVGLSGGDPLARRDILAILGDMLDAGLVPDIPTKVGLSRRRIQELRDRGVRIMQVSLDSADPAIVDRMVGLPGYHRRVFRLMEDLRATGMRLRTNSVLTPVNVGKIPALLDYLAQLGNVDKVNLSPYARSMFCHRDDLFVDDEQLEQLAETVEAKRQKYPHMQITLSSTAPAVPKDPEIRRRQWETRSLCTANRHGFVLLPDGRVTVCEELYDHPDFIIGDLKRQGVMDMWNSPQALALVRPDQREVPDGPCVHCDEFETCNTSQGRCWRDVIKTYGWDKPHYPDPRCPLAPAGARLG